MRTRNLLIFTIFITVLFFGNIYGTDRIFKEILKFSAPEARQGIAVDDSFFYVIGTREIAKYDKESGRPVIKWAATEKCPIIHLDSGVISDGKLYCGHSNYPGTPMTSSVEIWNAQTLQHIGTHSFGIQRGSCTWIDRHDGYWWAVFAHYKKFKPILNKGNNWTTLVKFDESWRILEAWVFPKEVLAKFGKRSNSGGSWGADGLLYCSGHDKPELYILNLPQAGSVLELVEIVPVNSQGQGIAWDRSQPGVIYTLRRKERQVVVSKLIE